MKVTIPDLGEFQKGCQAFEAHEKRDAMYKVATFLVSHFWGQPTEMTDGLGVLLLTWNQAFYRYGIFDFGELQKCLVTNFSTVEDFRNRDIFTLTASDEDTMKDLFCQFLEALRIAAGKRKDKKSPVAVAKALHVLAPRFFPLWDDKIARAYDCYYNVEPADKYISFCWMTQDMAEKIRGYPGQKPGKSLLKLIDEYNYAKYTGRWI